MFSYRHFNFLWNRLLMLGESLSWKSILAMVITLLGIAISILSRDGVMHFKLDLPLKGILLGIEAGVGQGVGLVPSKVGIAYPFRSWLSPR